MAARTLETLARQPLAMAIVLFKHQDNWSEALKVDERVISLFGRDLKIRQRWKADGKGGSSIGFGASVYPACILLTDYLGSKECGKHYVEGKRVLELGVLDFSEVRGRKSRFGDWKFLKKQ